jgi:hypothetical protein
MKPFGAAEDRFGCRVGEEVAPSPPTDPDERVSRIRFLTREIR